MSAIWSYEKIVCEIIIIIINKVLIKVTFNKVIAGALYIVICGWNAVKVLGWQLTVEWRLKQRCLETRVLSEFSIWI